MTFNSRSLPDAIIARMNPRDRKELRVQGVK